MVSTAGEKALCGCLYGLFWFLRYLHASGEFKRGYCGNDTKSNSYCGRWNYRSGKKSDNLQYTGCPVNWYSLSISIPDFPDGPMKKANSAILTRLV